MGGALQCQRPAVVESRGIKAAQTLKNLGAEVQGLKLAFAVLQRLAERQRLTQAEQGGISQAELVIALGHVVKPDGLRQPAFLFSQTCRGLLIKQQRESHVVAIAAAIGCLRAVQQPLRGLPR